MKYLASDFDGTLYFLETGFIESDLEQIRRFQAEGNRFGICTGRGSQGIFEPTGDLIHYDFYIIASGALILDRDKKILLRKYADRDALNQVIQHVGSVSDLVHLTLTGYEKKYCIIGNRERYKMMTFVKCLEDISDEILTVSVQFPTTHRAQELVDWIQEHLSDRLSAYRNVNSVDVVCKGCSKGSGIRFIRDYFHIKDGDIAGIGDSANDMPMLQEVDTAFTFHASEQTVRDAADVCVDSVAECIHHLM